MTTIFFISDTHFGHANILKFKNFDGSPVRSFASVDEMNETMVERWNSVVTEQDKVYHLGDVVFNSNFNILKRLKGKKRALFGNHDDPRKLIPYFQKTGIWRVFKEHNFTCSHIPLHPDSFRSGFNVHGHVHGNPVMKLDSNNILTPDPRYVNVCVEAINYTPISLEQLVEIIKKR